MIEPFPVGSRVAYDPTRGRLWLICPRCSRWNLTPLEERWEALEALEVLWEGLQARASTDNISLGRHPSGLTVVRVGRSSNDREFSFWRWGSRTGSGSAKRLAVGGGVVVTAVAGIVALPPMAGLGVGAMVALYGSLFAYLHHEGLLAVRSVDESGDPSRLTKSDFVRAGINPSDEEPGWSIHLQRAGFRTIGDRFWTQRQEQVHYWSEYVGDRAISVARKAFPLLNRRYSPERDIDDAIAAVAAGGGPEAFLRRVAAEKPRWVQFRHYPSATRLAMEMVLFQEEERRALEGDLLRLEEAWKEAEQLAAISDNLLTPPGWEELRARIKKGS